MLSRRLSWSVAVIATLTMTVSYIDRQTLAVLAPKVTEALHISDAAYGWLASAFSISYLLATPLAGWWIDRVGARRGLVGSLLVWSAIAAGHALVPNFQILFALRILLGFAEGPGFPGAAQTIYRVLPPHDRARGFGLLFMGSSIGSMIVPPVAAYLFALHGWRITFLITAVAGLVWVPLWILTTSRRDVAARLDIPVETSSEPRPSFLDLVREPIMQRAFASVFCAAPAIGFVAAWGAKYLVRSHHVVQQDVGHYLWLPALAFDVGSLLFGDLAARTRANPRAIRVLYAIAALLTSSIALLPFAATPWHGMIIIAITMTGGGAINTLSLSDMISRFRPQLVSFAGGTLAAAQSLALIIANPIIGRLVDRHHDYTIVAFSLGAWLIPGAVVWLLWRPTASARVAAE